MEVYKKERRKINRCIYQGKKEISEQFERNMDKGVNGNRNFFWKDVGKVGTEIEKMIELGSWR